MAQSVSDYEIQKTLERLLPALEPELAPLSSSEQDTFRERLTRIFPELLPMLLRVYGDRFDFFYHLQSILRTAAEYYAVRPAFLREVDAAREASPLWFQSQQMIGGVCYVDLFAGNLKGIREQIPYFKELGLTYLHLMPLFKSPESNNDGGYAISSFREVNPKYGTMTELKSLGEELRHNGINLVLDFVFNHTSDEHEWAKNALSGDRIYQNFYFMFPDRSLPDRYERNLREIFPEHAPGSFSYRPEIDRWVWTTFYPFQWDLNYRNPEVF
ncbi:MAG TPA: alpha-amylase family glycosyl hydrolase, partial [Aggregatilineales bacterium]|nr:alpha-amylase family glycosyl hydrolase [Aggregatilineales bacterium]